jgi:hypothetical protein
MNARETQVSVDGQVALANLVEYRASALQPAHSHELTDNLRTGAARPNRVAERNPASAAGPIHKKCRSSAIDLKPLVSQEGQVSLDGRVSFYDDLDACSVCVRKGEVPLRTWVV